MNVRSILARATLLALVPAGFAQTPLDTRWTYQGFLKDDGVPLTAATDFKFTLWDSPDPNATMVGVPFFVNEVMVVNGLFTTKISFGVNAFGDGRRFLEIAVRRTDVGGAFATLSPLQQLTPTLFSLQTRGIFVAESGKVGIGTNTPTEALEVVGTVAADKFVGDGAGLRGLSRLGSTVDLNNVAMLRWDLLNRNFPVVGDPRGLAFDGANIWVVNRDDESVTKLRASDGADLGTFPVGANPMALAFDGANLWVANRDNNNVTKLRASDGANLGTFAVGSSPVGVAFDGVNIWVANQNSNDVTRLRASDGAHLGAFPVGMAPRGLAFDGAHIWTANQADNTVTKLRVSDGADLGTFAVGTFPYSVAFDGANIWVVNNESANVTKLLASDGANLGTFSVGSFPIGLAFDGAHIWVANVANGTVTKLRALDGADLGTFPVGGNPWNVAFDGTNIWVTNIGSSSVTRISLVK